MGKRVVPRSHDRVARCRAASLQRLEGDEWPARLSPRQGCVWGAAPGRIVVADPGDGVGQHPDPVLLPQPFGRDLARVEHRWRPGMRWGSLSHPARLGCCFPSPTSLSQPDDVVWLHPSTMSKSLHAQHRRLALTLNERLARGNACPLRTKSSSSATENGRRPPRVRLPGQTDHDPTGLERVDVSL